MRTNLNSPSPQPDRSETQDRETSNRHSRRSRRPPGQRWERPVWQEVTAITVEEAEHSVRLRFPGKPDDHERQQLKDRNFGWSGSGGFWYARKTPENVAFARQIEANGFAPQDVAAFAGAEI